jgi:hypothetical protein
LARQAAVAAPGKDSCPYRTALCHSPFSTGDNRCCGAETSEAVALQCVFGRALCNARQGFTGGVVVTLKAEPMILGTRNEADKGNGMQDMRSTFSGSTAFCTSTYRPPPRPFDKRADDSIVYEVRAIGVKPTIQ